MPRIDYNGRRFRSVSNTSGGDVDGETIFEYHHEGDIVWATYHGGGVRFGTLVAIVDASDTLDMRYQHVNQDGVLMTGTCRSVPTVLPDGRLRLDEEWQWTSVARSAGRSAVEEILPAS